MSFLDSEEPLTSLNVSLDPAGEGDEFHTRNVSKEDWERRSIIQRTSDSVDVFCDLMDVQHGNLGANPDDDDLATLMVFRFRFDPQKSSRRVLNARLKIEFFPADSATGEAPELEAIAPEERWSLLPTTDQESVTQGGELSLGVAQIASATGKVSMSKTTTMDITDATTVTGSMNLGTGMDAGAYTCASWTLLENKRRESGVPDSLRVALLIKREDDEPFNAKVTIEADYDFATTCQRFWKKVPLDDPVLFNPKAEPERPKKGRSYGKLNLGGLDLHSLCDARMSAKAFWATGASAQ